MNRRRWLLVLLVLVCVGAASRARAQGDLDEKRARSHAPIPSSVFGPDQAREFLADRLHDTHELAELQKQFPALEKLAKEMIQHPDRFPLGPGEKQLLQRLRQNPAGWGGANEPDLNNPAWQQLLNRVLDQQGQRPGTGLEVSPEQLEAWKKLLDLDGGFGPVNGIRPAEGPAFGPPGAQPFMPRPTLPPMQPPARPFGPTLPPNQQEPSQPKPWLSVERLRSLGETLSRQEAVRNSGALQNAFRDFARRVLTEGEVGGGDKPATSLTEYLHLDRYVPKNNWQPSTSWLPHVGPNTFQPPAGFTMPRPDFQPASGASLWDAVVWVILFALLGLAGWRLRAWQQARQQAAAAWQPGPWPVDPAAVATRQELIRAFEHLSLLRFGRAAFTWNHLEIAGHLAQGDGGTEAAAQRLAALYEQARYAPSDGPLADGDLAAARRDLCFLAGAAAA